MRHRGRSSPGRTACTSSRTAPWRIRSRPESSCTPSSRPPRTWRSPLWTSPCARTPNSSDAYRNRQLRLVAETVRLTLTRGTTSILYRDLNLAAGETLRQVIHLAGDRFRAAPMSMHPKRACLDDEAFAWIEHARPLSVTTWAMRRLPRPLSRKIRNPCAIVTARLYPERTRRISVIFDRWAPRAF